MDKVNALYTDVVRNYMKKEAPSKTISPKEFYQLVIDRIHNPGTVPKGDWLPPEVVIDGYIVDNKISLEDQLEFQNYNLNKVRLCFLNCKLKGRYIFNSFNLRSITFCYTEIDVIQLSKSTLEIFDYKFSNCLGLTIKDTNFNQWLSLREGEIKNSIDLNNIQARGQIGITNINCKSLRISESNSSLNFYSGSYKSVRFYNNNFSSAKIFSLNSRALTVLTPIQIINDNSDYKYGKLELGPDFNNSVIIKGKNEINFNIEELEIKDSVFSDIRVTLDQINLKSILFKEFINTGQLDLFNIVFHPNQSTLHIENSFLGNTKFFNCNLPDNINFKFVSSDIREVSYNNVYWPSNLSNENLIAKIELYRQLKHIANKNNDTINSVRFYSIEKNTLYKSLKWSCKDLEMNLIFSFNKLSNDNNLSWLKPIGWNLIIQLVLFVLIGFFLSINCSFNINLFKEYLSPFARFLFMLNPAFKVETLDPNIDKNSISIILVTISRVASAYLIYQTVAAYRRYK